MILGDEISASKNENNNNQITGKMESKKHQNHSENSSTAEAKQQEKLRQEYRYLISEFQKLNAQNAYDALLEYLMNELAKIERKETPHSDERTNAQPNK